ncbi:MAG: NHL repeat-containing protein [Pirellulales bacterium]|nr:NHL repeat-containing protein [Pirellulales bacterium]
MISPRCVRPWLRCCTLVVLGALTAGRAAAAEYLVADRATNRVLAFDAATGAFNRVVLAEDAGLDEPTAMAFGPDGDLLVASLQSNLILRVNPATGASSTYLSTGSVVPGGLAYNTATGDLLVSQFTTGPFPPDGQAVFRYDSGGTLVGAFAFEAGPSGRTGMAFDSAGDLYVSAFFADMSGNGLVMKIDPQNNYGFSSFFASGAAVAQGGQGFNGLTFDAAGNLYVAALAGQSILKFEVDAGAVVGAGILSAPIAYPSGVLVGDDGRLLATSLGNNNPADPIYGAFLFPGSIRRIDVETGESLPFLKGDSNADTVVDGGDFLALQRSGSVAGIADWKVGFGMSGLAGDFQPTAIVYYNPVAATAPVPEPASIVLAAGLALGGFMALRRFA